MLIIRRSHDRLIFNLQIPIPGGTVFILRWGPAWNSCSLSIHCAVGDDGSLHLDITLLWRHKEPDGVSNHQPHDCLLIHLFGHRSRKHQSSASLAFVRGIYRRPVNSPHKWPVTRKMFPIDDVIMSWFQWCHPMRGQIFMTVSMLKMNPSEAQAAILQMN